MLNFKKLIKEAHLGNPLNEVDSLNDPALVKARASQMKRDKIEADEKAKQAALNKKYGSSFMDKLNAELDLKGELEDLKQEREIIMIDMEEEAEPEGGPIADRYGERLNQIDMRIADIQEELDDLRMYESVNEEVTQKQIDDIEDSGNIDIAYKKAMKLLNSLKDKEDESVNEGLEGKPQNYVKYTTQDGETAKSGLMSKREAIYKERDLVDSGVKKSAVWRIQKHVDLNGKPYTIDTELDKEIDYRKDEKGRPIKEITTTPVSGTKAGFTYSLDNRKYVLTNDVEGAQIGDYTNITLPKGTVLYNLPGGLMADHESLRQYAKLSGNIYFDKPTYAGIGIRRMPDILTAIENNSNVIEESLNENMGEWPKELTSRYSDEYRFELEKVTPTYQDKPGRAKYRVIDIESGELKGTPVFGTPESLMAFADDLIKPQGGRQSSHFGTNEGTVLELQNTLRENLKNRLK